MANKQLSAVIKIGAVVSSSLKSAIGTTKNGFEQIGSAIRQVESRQKELNRVIKDQERLGRAGSALKVELANQELAMLDKKMAKLRQVQAQEQRMATMRAKNQARAAEMAGMVGAGAVAIATFGAPVIQAAQFETAMLGVAKQVAGARDESGKLTQVYYDMAKQVQLLGREIPLATNEIAEMVAAGARMGVAKDELIDFTRTAAMMADAFELPAGELADSMGKIAGLFKIPIPEIGKLADAINFLDDNAISKGQDIIDFMTRVGGVASSVKITGQEMAALGSTLLTLGERTETAGTAVNAMFSKLAAADKGTKKFKAAMQEIGLSTREVQQGMQKDATGTLLKVMDAVAKLPKEKQLGVMVELVGLEHADTLAKLSNNTGEFRKQLEMANSEAAKGSMSREFQARQQTTMAQWQMMKNRLTELSVTIGSVLLPPLNKVLGVIGSVTSKITDFAQANPKLAESILTVVGALAGFGAVKFAVMGVVWAFNALKIAIASNPIGMALTLIATAAYLVYENWEPLKEFFSNLWERITSDASRAWEDIKIFFSELWDGIKTKASAAFEWVKQIFLNFTPLGLIIQNWEPIKGFFANLWEGVKSKASAAFEWFKQVLALPVIDIFRQTWEPIREFFVGLWSDITATASKAMEWIMGKINAVGDAWQSTKAFFGFGDDAAANGGNGAPLVGQPALPTPQLATGRGSNAYTDQSQTTIQVTQQPGEDSRGLARRIAEEQERQRQVRQRGLMLDGAPAQ